MRFRKRLIPAGFNPDDLQVILEVLRTVQIVPVVDDDLESGKLAVDYIAAPRIRTEDGLSNAFLLKPIHSLDRKAGRVELGVDNLSTPQLATVETNPRADHDGQYLAANVL